MVEKESYLFEIRHLFGATYCDTIQELKEVYKPVFNWLEENCPRQYTASAMDNAAFSDVNEDPYVGYYVRIHDKEKAMAFKLRWL